MNYIELIDYLYPAHRKVRGILLSHSRCVADLALKIAREHHMDLDAGDIEQAAMLHDIGIIFTDAPGIDCRGDKPYICHGPIGADIIREAGLDERFARVAERHTGSGLTCDEIVSQSLPLPLDRSYMPESDLEKLICYADCFYSKGVDVMRMKSKEKVKQQMARFGQDSLNRFLSLEEKFKSNIS